MRATRSYHLTRTGGGVPARCSPRSAEQPELAGRSESVGLTAAAGPVPGPFLEATLCARPFDRRYPVPGAVGAEDPGVGVVGQVEVEHLEQPGLELGVEDRNQHLDTAVEVALHEVG